MKNKITMTLAVLFLVGSFAFSASAGKYWRSQTRNIYQKGDFAWGPNCVQELEASTAEITSPSTTLDVSSLGSAVVLNSDQNITGATITGGTLNQVLYLFSGSGENTVRFDDSATTMILGGNVTITEGQEDSLILRCVNANGKVWQKIGGNDN